MDSNTTRRSRVRRLFGATLAGMALAVVIAAGVSAHGGGDPGGGFGGFGGGRGGGAEITAINGTQLSLTTRDGWTRTIDAAGATIMSGETAITLADLEVGDEIAVRQARNFDGSVAITRINVVAPHVEGTVTAVGASSITIRQDDATSVTVNVTATTTYNVNRAAGTLASVSVGSEARVQGTENADGSFTATAVSVHPTGLGGTVTATTADAITVADASGATAVIHVTAATSYRTVDGAGTLASVTVGSVVRAQGVKNADGSLNATAVSVGTADGGFGGFGHRGGRGGFPGIAPSVTPEASPSA